MEMSKRKTFEPRKTRYLGWLIKYFRAQDRPLSFTEILNHTKTWKWGMTYTQLSNVLSKCEYFNEVSAEKVYGRLSSGPYEVTVWELSEKADDIQTKEAKKCSSCRKDLVSGEIGKCKSCYLKWKREERAKRGEA
tara:strand:- start:407 stop:811 length:405 start_codon:yes stop_codon:yes gene_type:complete